MDIRIILDNRVRIATNGLPPDLILLLKAIFEHKNPEYAAKKHFKTPGWWTIPQTITTWRSDAPNTLSVPRGGLGKVRGLLISEGYDFFLEDRREPGRRLGEPLRHNVTLFPHQVEIVETVIAKEQCIVRAPTGCGKTTALLGVVARLAVPSLVVVHSKGLMDQWVERAEKELDLKTKDIGILQGARRKLKPFTLGLQQTIGKLVHDAEFRQYFGCVLVDECHLAAARTFLEAVDPIPARYRIGTSADHRRKDKKEFLIRDVFGEVGIEIEREELVKSGHILDVEVRVVPTDFQADWYGVPEDEDDSKRIDFVRLVQEMAANPARNQLIVDIATTIGASGEQMLVMSHERDHCHALAPLLVGMGIHTGYLIGGDDYRTEFRSVIAGLRSGVVRAGVGTYKAIGTGIDLPKVSAAIASTPIAANEQFFGQVRGRVCRTAEGKTGALLYVLWDRHVFPRHLSNLSRWNVNTVVLIDGAWVPAKQYLKNIH